MMLTKKTFRLHIQQKTTFLSSNLSVYCSKLLKVMLELHTMSRCCCQSFAVYFFIPTRGQDIYKKKSIYIYIYIKFIFNYTINSLHI